MVFCYGSPSLPHLYFRISSFLAWDFSKLISKLHSLQTWIHLPPCLQSYYSKTSDHLSVLIKTLSFLPSLNSLVQYRRALSWRGVSSKRKACRGGKWCPQTRGGGIRKPGAWSKKPPSKAPEGAEWLLISLANRSEVKDIRKYGAWVTWWIST